MPAHLPGSCTVCSHEQRKAIDHALVNKTSPLRALAKQFGPSLTSLFRHKRNHLENELAAAAAKSADQDEEATAIDAEIAKLKRAQKRAERRRNDDVKIKISREIRTWLELRAKLRAKRPVAPVRGHEEPASRAEALQLAKDILEMEVNSGERDEIISWLNGLLERAETISAKQPSVQPSG